MAIFFEKVPLEVRHQVYQELLVNKHRFFVLDGSSRHRIETELHPAILRTCKQAYVEGSAILYGQNHFRYTELSSTALTKDDCPVDNIEKIKHLEVEHTSIATRANTSTKLDRDLRDVNYLTTVIDSITASNCSLKTFFLRFEFPKDKNPARYVPMEEKKHGICLPSVNIVQKYANDKKLQEAISGLHVKNMISIEASSYCWGKCKDMGKFVRNIGFMKQWTITDKLQDSYPTGFEATHVWKWSLEPATAATQNKIPKSLDARDEDEHWEWPGREGYLDYYLRKLDLLPDD